MAIFTPFGFIKEDGIQPPPVAADAADFIANNYVGTGNWLDANGVYSAAPHNSPTFNGDPGTRYFSLDGNDGFQIPNAQHTGTFFNTQNLGAPALAEGSLELYIKPYSITGGRFLGSWSALSTQRGFIFGYTTANQITTYYQTVSNTRRTFRNTVAPTTLNVWNHIMIRWSMANDTIQITINDTNNHFSTFNFPTTGVWQGSGDTCVTLGYLEDVCTNSREYLNADVACIRAFNSFLSNEDVTALYDYWSNLGY